MSDAIRIAQRARREGLLAALRSRREMPLSWFVDLISDGKYAGDLGSIRVDELSTGADPLLVAVRGETAERTVMRVFRGARGQWFSSGFFVRYLGLERWTAQKLCAELANKGLLERRGRTAGTRYRFLAGCRERVRR